MAKIRSSIRPGIEDSTLLTIAISKVEVGLTSAATGWQVEAIGWKILRHVMNMSHNTVNICQYLSIDPLQD